MSEKLKSRSDIYIGREQSWLRFNERVLLQADAAEVPLLERMRFCAIFTSNLDEFFMVRAGSLHDRSLLPDVPPDNKTGLTAAEQLAQIYADARRLYKKRDEIVTRLFRLMSARGLQNVHWEQLDKDERRAAKQFFRRELAPLVHPYIIDTKHPLGHLENKLPHALLSLRSEDGRALYGLVPMPRECPRYLSFPITQNGRIAAIRYITADEILMHEAADLYTDYAVKSRLLLRITRNADIEIADNFSDDPDYTLDYPAYLKILLKKREKLAPVRIEYLCSEKSSPDKALTFLCSKLGLTKEQCFRSASPIDYSFVSPLIKEASAILPDEAYRPIVPRNAVTEANIFDTIDDHDVLLSYPYHSMRTYLDFLREAVFDPGTQSICITLYRMAEHSQIISLLRTAAENGVHVTTVVELKARFDEANNIHWAELLEESGCHVIYGMNGLKVHSKVTLITRKRGEAIRQYAHIGTGNYNEQTAKLYTDLSILTADPVLTADAHELFRSLMSGVPSSDYRALLVAPTTLKPRILAEIAHEKMAALTGKNAYICMKLNSMTDKDIIDALADAAKAGVRIDLIVRGICCLKAGVPGETENIRVMSIVGRYLEHSRIFIFGEDDGNIDTTPPRVYIGSADMMTRNTTRRIEVITPIKSREIAETLIKLTKLELADTVKSSDMLPDGSYKKREPGDVPHDSQIELYKLFH